MTEQTAAYPVGFSVERPERYQRVHLLLRVLIWFLVSWVGRAFWAYLAALGITVLLIAQAGGSGFHERYGALYDKLLRFYVGIFAYLWITTDGIPAWGANAPAHLTIRHTGTPSVGSALLRIVLVIPHVLALFLLSFVAVIAGLVAFFSVLIAGTVPSWARNFLVAYLTWEMRVWAYFLSLVEEYPPFRFESDAATAA